MTANAPPPDAIAYPRYDFRLRHRMAAERLRPLRFLYDRFARNVGISLSAYLRVATEVQLRTIAPVTYDEFIASVTEPTVYYAIGLEPLTSVAGLEVNPVVAHAMIDRMLGGRGAPAPVSRALTDIEQRVVDNVVRLILEHMTEAWRQVTPLQFRLGRQETRPEMLDVATPGETVIALRFGVRVGAVEGAVQLCLPAALLDALRAAAPDSGVGEGSDTEREMVGSNLARVRLQTEALLPTMLPATELLQLTVGDVLSLGRSVETPVELHVSGTRRFTGVLTRRARGSGLTIRSRVGRGRDETSGSADPA